MLAVTFEDVEAFSREFHANLTKGGIFVPTEETFALRESVEVGLDLRFCGEALVLRGEVVHQVPAGLANAGATPGVAVQFERTAGELRELFEGLVGEIPEPGPAGRPAAPEPGVDRRDAARETARVAARVATLAGDGRTVVVVTHDLNLASQFAARVLLMDQGRVVALGRPDDVLQPDVLCPVYGARLWFGELPSVAGEPARPCVLPWAGGGR